MIVKTSEENRIYDWGKVKTTPTFFNAGWQVDRRKRKPVWARKPRAPAKMTTPIPTSMTMPEIIKFIKNQPFFLVEDDAWVRMYKELIAGKPFAKSYITTCPYDNRPECKCHYFRNTLGADGRSIVRYGKPVVCPALLHTIGH
jgi:hypothetical protein